MFQNIEDVQNGLGEQRYIASDEISTVFISPNPSVNRF